MTNKNFYCIKTSNNKFITNGSRCGYGTPTIGEIPRLYKTKEKCLYELKGFTKNLEFDCNKKGKPVIKLAIVRIII